MEAIIMITDELKTKQVDNVDDPYEIAKLSEYVKKLEQDPQQMEELMEGFRKWIDKYPNLL